MPVLGKFSLTNNRKLLFAIGGIAGLFIIFRIMRKITPSKYLGKLVEGGGIPKGVQLYGTDRVTHIHAGIDIPAKLGSPIYAPTNGKIAAIWPNGKLSKYGNTILLQHNDNYQTLYAHLNAFADGLQVGKNIKKGDLLAFVGNTQLPNLPGKPHLHFEVMPLHTLHVNRSVTRNDPLEWLKNNKVAIG